MEGLGGGHTSGNLQLMKTKGDGELSILGEGNKAAFLGQGLRAPSVFPRAASSTFWGTQLSSDDDDITVKMAGCLSSPRH